MTDLGARDSVVPLPTGIVTFLYTDIEGSTKLWQEHSERMPHALERHDALISQAVEAEGGVIFRTMGDALCVAFSSPPSALAAASAAQRSLSAEPWEGGYALKVRSRVGRSCSIWESIGSRTWPSQSGSTSCAHLALIGTSPHW